MELHHIALGAADVDAVARFYATAFQLSEETRHYCPDGALRSVWLRLGSGRLMIEHTRQELRPATLDVARGPFLLAFTVTAGERAEHEARLEALGAVIEARTEWTAYARDPEGNRIALSAYPAPL